MSNKEIQVWARDATGKVFGPLTPLNLRVLLTNGTIQCPIQLSSDGSHYVLPGFAPGIRMLVPRQFWGSTVIPNDSLDAQWAKVFLREMPSVQAADKEPGNAFNSVSQVGGPEAKLQATAAPPPSRTTSEGIMPTTCTLAEQSVMDLYCCAVSKKETGCLTLSLVDRTIQIGFQQGRPQFIESNHPSDAVEQFLLREQLCQPAQINEASKQKNRFGADLLNAVISLGFLNVNVAFHRLTKRATSLLHHAFLAEQGTCSWSMQLPAILPIPLGNPWVVYFEQLRRTSLEEVQRRMTTLMNLPVKRSNGLLSVENLHLNALEARALTHYDGRRSLAQLCSDLPKEANTLMTTAWLLRPLKLVSFSSAPGPASSSAPASAVAVPTPPSVAPAPTRSSVTVPTLSAAPTPTHSTVPAPTPPSAAPAPMPPRAVPAPMPPRAAPAPMPPRAAPGPMPPQAAPAPMPPRAAPAPMPPRAAPAPTSPPAAPMPQGHDAQLEQLTALLNKMKNQSHFEVLGIPEAADAKAVKVAYLKLAKQYHPDTVPAGAAGGAVAKAKADIFSLVTEAHRVLSDDKLRADYLAALEAGEKTEDKIDISTIFQADEYFQKSRALIYARKFPEALKKLDDAITINAKEAEYYIWRGYAKFFCTPDKKLGKAEAMKDINYGLKQNPNIAAAQYFIGMIAKSTGDKTTAKKSFTACLQLDPQHIDAQRELRIMK